LHLDITRHVWECREMPVLENDTTEVDNEQTWPSEAEMASSRASTRRNLKPGTSAYQACWILDEDDDEHELADHEGADDEQMDDEEHCPLTATAVAAPSGDGADMIEGGQSDMEAEDDNMGAEEEGISLVELEQLRASKRKEAEEEELDFPDEIEIPQDVPARVRFMVSVTT
jgi:pre-rRNA-processing protein TSR1